jgi:hypothetical protein
MQQVVFGAISKLGFESDERESTYTKDNSNIRSISFFQEVK